MTPKEIKARELIKKFEVLVPEEFGVMDLELAKKCALICVDEMRKDRYFMLSIQFDENYAEQMIDYNSKDLEDIKETLQNYGPKEM